MLCRLFCAAAIVCVAATLATAQDPTKVEPKNYKLHFENERVQVVDIHYGPHEKSEMHDHPGGVAVSLTGGHLRFTDQSGKVTEVYAKAGEARWFPPFKHRVENVGDEPYTGIYIGVKGKLPAGVAHTKEEFPVTAEQMARILADYAAATAKP
jgi:quercetin dioxygenase-like cupin family protein